MLSRDGQVRLQQLQTEEKRLNDGLNSLIRRKQSVAGEEEVRINNEIRQVSDRLRRLSDEKYALR